MLAPEASGITVRKLGEAPAAIYEIEVGERISLEVLDERTLCCATFSLELEGVPSIARVIRADDTGSVFDTTDVVVTTDPLMTTIRFAANVVTGGVTSPKLGEFELEGASVGAVAITVNAIKQDMEIVDANEREIPGFLDPVIISVVHSCGGRGGDTDGDGICDDGDGSEPAGQPPCSCQPNSGPDCLNSCDDNCPFVSNPLQEDCCTPGDPNTPDGIGDACQCGDVTGEGAVNSLDATMIKRQALSLSAPQFLVPDNCDVTGDGNCNSSDATMVLRKALNISAPLFGNNCPNFTGSSP